MKPGGLALRLGMVFALLVTLISTHICIAVYFLACKQTGATKFLMAILGGLRRNWRQLNPPVVSKHEDALKFGILGAAKIASVIPIYTPPS